MTTTKSPVKLDRQKRLAAGHVLSAMFLQQQGTHWVLHRMISHTGLLDGLTEKEAILVQRIASRMHEDGELLRRLGHRLQGLDIQQRLGRR